MVKAILGDKKSMTRRIVKPQPVDKPIVDAYEYWHWVDAKGIGHDKHCPYGQVGDKLWVRETHKLTKETINGELFIKAEYKFECDGDNSIRYFKWDSIPQAQQEKLNKIKTWGKWRPARFMYKFLARITLEITGVRVERLQEITEEGAKVEGITRYPQKFQHNHIYTALADWQYKAYPIEHHIIKGERLRFNYPSLGYANFYAISRPDGIDSLVVIKPQEAFTLLEDEALTFREAYGNLWDSINGKKYPWVSNPWGWVIEFKRIKNA